MSDPVLLVDDSPQDLQLLREAFKEAGRPVTIQTAESVDAAQAYLKSQAGNGHPAALPKLILLDLQMPRKDGFELLRWLRCGEGGDALRRIPVIMLTTSNAYGDIKRAYDAGANSFLVKPTGFDDLVKSVAQVADYWLRFNRSAGQP